MVFLQFLKILILSKEIYSYDLVPEKYKLKNGRLVKEGVLNWQLSRPTGYKDWSKHPWWKDKQEYDFRNYDYFDEQNRDHLHAVLDNHPLRPDSE